MCNPSNTFDFTQYISLGVSFLAFAVSGAVALFNWKEHRNTKYSEIFAWSEIKRENSEIIVADMKVINSTEYPIYLWKVRASWETPESSNLYEVSIGNESEGVLPPGKHTFNFTDIEKLPQTDATISVKVSFTDSLGRLCKRTSSGKLVIA